jgi:hypothetical protein
MDFASQPKKNQLGNQIKQTLSTLRSSVAEKIFGTQKRCLFIFIIYYSRLYNIFI